MAVPTPEQLVLAVKQFLETDVLPKLENRTAFHARVATNVLAIVARDLSLTPEKTEAAAFSSLLPGATSTPAQDLCMALRNGMLTEESDGLLETLLAASKARVAADNPKYSTLHRLQN
jgi:hypothetical protein